MDKVVGRALLGGLVLLSDRLLCVSGRLSFELVQKAAVAGAPILVGVSAPARWRCHWRRPWHDAGADSGAGHRVNVYTHPEPII